MKKLYVLSLLIFITGQIKAQTNLNLYNFRNVGESNLLNPAIRPQANVVIGLCGTYISAQSPQITLADLFNINETPDNTFKRIVADRNLSFNNMGISSSFDPIFIGFAVKKNYFTLGMQLNFDFYGSLPKDLLGLTQGSTFFQNTLNRQAELGNFAFNSSAYTAYHVGYTTEITDKLSLGFRVKYIQGLYNINSEENSLKFSTNPDSLYLKASFKANTAGFDDLIKYNFNTESLIYSLSHNGQAIPDKYKLTFTDYLDAYNKRELAGTGWGFDVGGKYKFNQHVSVSASLIDIGWIKWNNNIRNYSLEPKEFNYKGQDIKDIASLGNNNNLNDRIKKIQDSLQNDVFKPKESTDAYTTYLAAKLYLGAQYAVNYNNTFDLVFFNNFGPKNFNPALSLSYTKKFLSVIDIRLSGTYYNSTINNAGLGFSLNLGPFQTYLFSDNLIAAINYDEAKFVNLRTGINWNFGRNNDNDGDGIPNKLDKCKNKYGSIKLKGCPDKDGDGIIDIEDDCKNEKGKPCTKGCPDIDKDCIADKIDSCVNDSGSVRLNGCPDKDKDGIADKYDSCPNEPGLAKFDGCPDTDGDSVIDKNDECPSQAGSIENKGCPDTDGDGILDKDDACPTEKGLKKFGGCPDTDEDGVMDKLDSCINDKGSAQYNGCPDTDGDGIIDKKDKCPQEAGTEANFGCPILAPIDTNLVVLTVEEKKVLNEAFSNLEFETGTSKIKESSLNSLAELAILLQAKTMYKLKISGHTDNAGKAAANLKLSQARAKAVKDFLVTKQVEAPRMIALGFGSKKPIANNKTAEGRQKNRRVEFQILK